MTYSSGWPEEARQQLVAEIILTISENSRMSSTAIRHIYPLVLCILRDRKYTCWKTQTLIKILKTSPIWERVKGFLDNGDSRCARKGCHCYYRYHDEGKCKGVVSKRIVSSQGIHHYQGEPCSCTAFIAREL